MSTDTWPHRHRHTDTPTNVDQPECELTCESLTYSTLATTHSSLIAVITGEPLNDNMHYTQYYVSRSKQHVDVTLPLILLLLLQLLTAPPQQRACMYTLKISVRLRIFRGEFSIF